MSFSLQGSPVAKGFENYSNNQTLYLE